MINVKEAVEAAQNWARELYSDAELRHLRLEEVQFSDHKDSWIITLGWLEPAVRETGLALMGGALEKLPRVYKTFEVDADSGEIRSMKMREVA